MRAKLVENRVAPKYSPDIKEAFTQVRAKLKRLSSPKLETGLT